MPEHVGAALRRLVRARAQARCEYCQTPEAYATQALSVEHILPLSKHGSTSADNLALSCQGCNNHKFTRTRALDPVTELTVALYNPRRQIWSDHFAWLPDARRLIGISPSGRATVETLRLNRSGLMGLRQALIALGVHP
ncbi:HNH endonuclease [Prosthecobacter sp.]|uniref:HNH endonuclease n=1 Tax=Prosthecobacter sp. TaxID=1965333 RepID=UPI0037835B22